MTKCTICKRYSPADEMIIDHILPRSHPDFNEINNVRLMHRLCLKRLSNRYWRLWYRFLDWLESWQPCPKEQQGYRCQHRIMSNGKKECGDE